MSLFFKFLETNIDVSNTSLSNWDSVRFFWGVLPFCHSLAFENDLISKMYRSLFVDQATPFASARVLLAKMPRCSGDFVRWKSSDFFNRNPGWGNTLIHPALNLPLFGIEWICCIFHSQSLFIHVDHDPCNGFFSWSKEV